MKTRHILVLAVALTIATGCHSVKIGDARVLSFGQRTQIKELSLDPKTGLIKMKGYNNNQVDGMVELFNAGVAAGKTMAK